MIVLDTHVWVWWVSGAGRLTKRAARAIEEAREHAELAVSSISTWEVGQLVAKQRLTLTMDVGDWIARSESLPFLRFVPVDNQIALCATRLPASVGKDPADRIICATSIVLEAALVTKDRRLGRAPAVETIW